MAEQAFIFFERLLCFVVLSIFGDRKSGSTGRQAFRNIKYGVIIRTVKLSVN